jgi:hypothetical protein
VHGLGPEQQVDNTQGGYAIIEVEVEKNPLLQDSVIPQVPKIPSWIKNNAGWWADGTIDDDSFVSGIEYLIKENILHISSNFVESTSDEIPSWIKNNAGWWADGTIDDDSFVSGIEYLVNNGIISVN